MWRYDKMKTRVFAKKMILNILFLVLAVVIIFYNAGMYFAHIEGKLSIGWYFISIIVPLIVLIAGYLKVKEFERKEV
jgi:cytochrome c biogenesis protein CcdA